MYKDKFHLILQRAENDAPQFSAEYLYELQQFSSSAVASRQMCLAIDSNSGKGGPLGEFLFDNASNLITSITTYGVAWLNRKTGRQLRLKVRGIEIVANNLEEVEKMAKIAQDLKNS